MPNRCGAKGIVIQRESMIGIEVISLESEVTIGHLRISLPEDISVGQFIPMKDLHEEHRGIVILDNNERPVAEGEIWPIKKGADNLQFISDFDEYLTNVPVEDLVGYKVKIKPEICDEVGAAKRLKEIKKLF